MLKTKNKNSKKNNFNYLKHQSFNNLKHPDLKKRKTKANLLSSKVKTLMIVPFRVVLPICNHLIRNNLYKNFRKSHLKRNSS